ncbi:MAG: Fe-S cluster assembly protein SufD [Geminicoccaceae bacterium]|nr:Fe-S cluster assembly protein SufD [Geminicoccaceae bacterium]
MTVAKRHVEVDPAFARAFHEASRRLGRDAGLGASRRERLDRFLAQGMPTPRVEAWKYTNVGKTANQPFALATKRQIGVEDVSPWLAGGPAARRIIFANGHLVPEMSHVGGLPEGVTVQGLAKRLQERPDEVRRAIDALIDGRGFTDLNAAFVEDGAWIEVADGVLCDKPLQLLFVTAGDAPAMAHPRVVVRLGRNSRLHLIESHVGHRPGPGLTNLVLQIRVAEGGRLDHDRFQTAGEGATALSKADVEVAGRGVYDQTVLSLGGALQRNESEVRITGSNAAAHLNGAFMPTAAEHVDTLIQMHHMAPDCESNQFYKGVLSGRSRGVFAGKIIVHQEAQRTNAFQQSNNLLRSDDAEIDAKPELEIYADDVKCSHGATVGDLDDTALFYLRSRGLPRDLAEAMLTYAFAGEVVERFKDEALRATAKRALFRRLPGGEALMGML